jgi:hypothetical protein
MATAKVMEVDSRRGFAADRTSLAAGLEDFNVLSRYGIRRGKVGPSLKIAEAERRCRDGIRD